MNYIYLMFSAYLVGKYSRGIGIYACPSRLWKHARLFVGWSIHGTTGELVHSMHKKIEEGKK